MSAILKFDFQRRKQLRRFFWSKLSKLHKKDQIFLVTTTFSLKQWETRTNSVPIPHPLTQKTHFPKTLFKQTRQILKFFENIIISRRKKKCSTRKMAKHCFSCHDILTKQWPFWFCTNKFYWWLLCDKNKQTNIYSSSGVARAFPGGRGRNEEEKRRKIKEKWEKLQENEERLRKSTGP